MGAFNIPDYIFIPLMFFAIFSTVSLVMVLGVNMKIPYYFTQLKAAFKKKPIYIVHLLNHAMQMHVTKRKGGDENTLDLPGYMGAKYVPDSSAVESFGLLKVYHGFEKSALAHNPEYSAAITTFMKKLEQHGIPPSVNVIDALFYAKLQPEEMICVPKKTINKETNEVETFYVEVQVTQEEYDKLVILKKDLDTTVVENGLMSYNKVSEFLQYSDYQNSQNLDEARSILYKKAIEESTNPNKAQDYIQLAIVFLMVGVIIVVILKAAGML